jgi:putative membrane protein
MASGIGAKALLAELLPQWLIIATGSVLVLFSALCFGAAVWRHLYPGVRPPLRWNGKALALIDAFRKN